MPLAVRIILLLLFLALPGCLTLPLFRRGLQSLDGLERIFLAAVLGAGACALVAFILAATGVYSLGALLAGVLGLSAVLLVVRRPAVKDLGSYSIKAAVLAVLAVVLAIALFSPPSHFAFGGFDVGTYANITAHIDRTGRIDETDHVVSSVAPERRDMLYRANPDPNIPYEAREFQGFYITDYNAGEVVPQFFYLWPSLMAVFASFLGTAGMFWTVTFMAVLALLGLFLFVRRYLGLLGGTIAAVLALTFMPMVYFSKYTTSEICNLAFFLAGMLVLGAYLEPSQPVPGDAAAERVDPPFGQGAELGLLAGFFFALGMLTRIDFLFVAVPLGVLFLYRIVMKTARLGDYLFLGMLGLGLVGGLTEGFVLSTPYTATLFAWLSNGRLANWLPWIILAVAVIALALIFRSRLRAIAKLLGKHRKALVLIGAGALILAALYLYFLRPRGVNPIVGYTEEHDILGPTFAKDTFVRWGWYFSWLGLALAVLGYAFWLVRQRRFKAAVPWVIGMFFSAYYVIDMRSNPLHIMVMRRLIPIIFPIALLMICYALVSSREYANMLLKRTMARVSLGDVVLGVLVIPLVVFFALSSRPVYGLEEGATELAFTREVASHVAEGSTVLISPWLGNLMGPSLRYFEGIETARLTFYETVSTARFNELLGDLSKDGGPVYLLWDNTQEARIDSAISVSSTENLDFQEEVLEASYLKRPQARQLNSWHFTLYELRSL